MTGLMHMNNEERAVAFLRGSLPPGVPAPSREDIVAAAARQREEALKRQN